MSRKLIAGVGALLVGGGLACYAVLMPGPRLEPGQATKATDLSRVQDRFTALEQRLDKLESSTTQTMQELRVAELQSQVTALEEEVTRLKSERALAAPKPAKAGATKLAGQGASENLKKEVLAAVKKDIDSAVEEKTKEMARKLRRRGPGGGEVQLDDLATNLKLDGRQRLAVENEAREAQRKARFIMDTPMDDGTKLVDVLADAMALQKAGRPEAGGQFMRFFSSMGKEVPGTGRTYGEMLREVSQNSMKVIRQELGPEQLKELEDMRVDPQRIQGITDSPWADLDGMVQQRVDKLAADNKGS